MRKSLVLFVLLIMVGCAAPEGVQQASLAWQWLNPLPGNFDLYGGRGELAGGAPF